MTRRICAALFFFFVLPIYGKAQEGHPVAAAKQLCDGEQWQEAVQLLQATSRRSADLQLCYGVGLAQLGKLDSARDELLSGQRQYPRDKRFPSELAGVFFRQKHYSGSEEQLHKALRIDQSDSYANNFLGTIYFLEHNLGAALKYWNRANKPMLADVRAEPRPKIKPGLLDSAFAFSPASLLRLQDIQTTDVRLRELGIFPNYQFDLQARLDGKFDLVFRNWEKNAFGGNKWIALFLLLRGLPAQTIYPEYFNIRNEALNFRSSYRWDKEKRRVDVVLEGPFLHNAAQHFRLGIDLRNENWDLRPSFSGPAPLLGSLNLRREAAFGTLSFLPSGRWQWTAGLEVSHRDFRSVITGPALDPSLLLRGYELKESLNLHALLWELPEKRLTLSADASSHTGHIWSQPGRSFEKLQGAALLRWSLQPAHPDYEIQQRAWGGKTFGNVPFDELATLGIGGDNDLWLRGHIATRDGRKGSAPLGRNYFLSNTELDKNVYQFQFLSVKAGPFFDTGKIFDPLSGLGSHKWLWDTGAQVKASAFGFGVEVSLGRDLRAGNNAFYVTLLR